MNARWVRCFLAATVAGGVVTLGVSPAWAEASAPDATWTATVLPVPAEAFSVRVNGTDRVDQIVGSFATFEGGSHQPGVIWRGGQLTVLGEAFGEPTDLTAVNTSGVAVGSHRAAAPGSRRHATRYVDGHFEDLPAPAGAASEATSINERGDIVGTADSQLILWPASDPTGYRLLPMPFPTGATGVSIDDDGTVVASVLEPVGSGPSRAYRWDRAGRPHELQRVDQNAGHSVLTISNGRIAGGFSPKHTVIWNSRGQVRRVLPDTLLYAMNGSGHLLARAAEGGPWFVEENGCRVALPDSFLPSGPTTLTNDGAVAGYSFDSSTGRQTAVLWRRT